MTNRLLDIYEDNVLEHFCWSGDVETLEELEETCTQLPLGLWIKIDRLGEKLMGEEAFEVVRAAGFKLFIDAKLVEIASKIAKLTRAYMRNRPDMLNIMAVSWSNGLFHQTGKLELDDLDALKQFAEICSKGGVRPCGVTELTTVVEEVVDRKYNKRTRVEQVLTYVGALVDAGIIDIVCAVGEIPAVVAEFPQVRPWPAGIRPAGVSVANDDQANANTPEAALRAGAYCLVTGRPFTNGDIPTNVSTITGNVVATAKEARLSVI